MRETAYRLAVKKPLPKYPVPDIPFRVTYVRYESGLHEYYRSVIPGIKLREKGLCEVTLQDEGTLQERIKESDVICVSRPNSPNEVETFKLLKEAGKIMVVDTDDYVEICWMLGETLARVWSEERVADFEECVRLADLVTVSVQPLADRMLEVGARKVAVLDNMLDPRSGRWDFSWPADDGKVRIGWIAGYTHAEDAAIIEEPVKRILEEFPEAVLVTMGYMPSWIVELNPDQVEVRRTGTILDLPQLTLGIDIALGPLMQNDFNLYRSPVKCWESVCMGSCFVCSDYGPYHDSLKNGEHAVLCSTQDDWYEALKRLVSTPSARKKLWTSAFEELMRRSADWQVRDWYWAYRGAVKESDIYKKATSYIKLLQGR